MNAMPRMGENYSPVPTIIPSLREVSPRYATIEDRRAALNARQQELDAEYRRLWILIAENQANRGISERDQRVAAVAGLPEPQRRHSDAVRLSEVADEREVLREALHLVEVDQRDAWLEASAEVCRHVADEHTRLQLDMFRAAVSLHDAWSRHEVFLAEVRKTGAAFSSLRPQPPTFLGVHPTRRQDQLAQWFRDLVEAGHVTKADLPAAYR